MRLAVLPQHRPTLPDLLAPRLARLPAAARRALAAVVVLLALVVLFVALRGGDDGVHVVRSEPIAFNLHYAPPLAQVAPHRGELLRLEHRAGGRFVQAFTVSPLELPAYRGDVGGMLPAFASREIAALRARYQSFELVQEGKTRVNQVAGYALIFRARLGRRRLYAREVLLPEPQAGARRGVRLLIEATPVAGVPRAEDAGLRGATKRPFRAFRFGTEKP